MKAQIGQRWCWKTLARLSEVIFEIVAIEGGYATCKYLQIIKRGYPVDSVGYLDRLPIRYIEEHTAEYTYLEGQDRAL